eukprot:TRINITY_DN4178_c0_g1_i1.p1 TRINITY_DN4178_c0_g1~~TRINITY_DN4178_c0_g1_i1.p1  ORF type:complete len:113 (-),score=11.59 TRINITY_DN4178_c0_g1_i1:300-638(-)
MLKLSTPPYNFIRSQRLKSFFNRPDTKIYCSTQTFHSPLKALTDNKVYDANHSTDSCTSLPNLNMAQKTKKQLKNIAKRFMTEVISEWSVLMNRKKTENKVTNLKNPYRILK